MLRDEIRTLANELIDAVADKGRCDFMPAVAEQLLAVFALRISGQDFDHGGLCSRRELFVEMGVQLAHLADGVPELVFVVTPICAQRSSVIHVYST